MGIGHGIWAVPVDSSSTESATTRFPVSSFSAHQDWHDIIGRKTGDASRIIVDSAPAGLRNTNPVTEGDIPTMDPNTIDFLVALTGMDPHPLIMQSAIGSLDHDTVRNYLGPLSQEKFNEVVDHKIFSRQSLENMFPERMEFYKGKLSDFDVNDFLSSLDDTNYRNVHFDNPAFFLIPVRKNNRIKADLRAITDYLDEIEEICEWIDNGDWDHLEHIYTYDDSTSFRGKDALLFAFAARRITRDEFATAQTVLNVKEQYMNEFDPPYTGTAPELQNITLPQRIDKVARYSIFKEDGTSLTDEASEYLLQIAENLSNFHQKYDEPPAFDPGLWRANAEMALRNVPRNLQFVYQIDNASLREGGGLENPAMKFQINVAEGTMPFASDYASPNRVGNYRYGDYMFCPSSAILNIFHSAFSSDVCRLRPCLGSVGIETLAKLHAEGRHPVAIFDDRVRSNPLAPHSFLFGVLDASMHDEHFHGLALTKYSQAQRQFCARHLPAVMRQLAIEDPILLRFRELWIARLVDMSIPNPRHMNNAALLATTFDTTVRELMSRPVAQELGISAAHRHDAFAKCQMLLHNVHSRME